MDTLISIALQFLWAIIGALLGVIIPALIEWWKNKQKVEFAGKWLSSYQGIDEPPGTWITEKVTVTVGLGGFRLKNAKNSHGYDYTASGSIKEKMHLIGNWKSQRPQETVFGAFMLTTDGRGRSLYGYWVGPNKDHKRKYARWVLGRTPEDIERAKGILET